MLKFNSKPAPHELITKKNHPSIHCNKMDCICDKPKQKVRCSIHKEKNKMGDVDKKIDEKAEINFKQILQSILPQFCLQSMGQCDRLNQNTNELVMSNERRSKNGNKMHETQIQMYRICQAEETKKQKLQQIVCRKSVPTMTWECMDSVEVDSRYVIYAIGGQITHAYLPADASADISIVVYDKYASNFSIVAENAVHLQLEYEYNDYLRVDLNKKVYMVTIKWINTNLLICGLSNGSIVLINVADLLTSNTTDVLVERLSVSAITQIKILTQNISSSLMDRIMANNLSCSLESVLIVLTKDEQLFIVDIVSNCRKIRKRYAMMVLYKYYTLLGTQMVRKYEQIKQQRSRQTKNLIIIEQSQGIKIAQGSRSGIIKIWMIPIEHLTANMTANTKSNIKLPNQFKQQNDSQKQKKNEQVKHKEEDIGSISLKIKQQLQNFIILISEGNQLEGNQKTASDTEMKDNDTSHGNSQMEIQLSHDKQGFDQIDFLNNQIDMVGHQNSEKLNLNHQSLISTYEQLNYRQNLHEDQSNQQVDVKAPPLRYSINPASIITSLFYDSQLLELQRFGKFLICITANGFLTILAIDEDTCKRSQNQNEYRNNFFGQISEAYQVIMEEKIFVSKKEDEKWYEQYVGMIIKKRNLYVMINKIWERRKKIQEVQSYIKIIKVDQKYRITKIQVILLNTGANFARNKNKISYFQIRESKIINDCFKMRHKKYQEGKKCKQILSDVFVASFQNSYLQRYMNVVVQSEHIYYEEQTSKDINHRQKMRQVLKKQHQQYKTKYQINHWKITDQYLSTQP